MSHGESLSEGQCGFFGALGGGAEVPVGLRGRFDVYRYAYFERIRESIEDDYPRLFSYLETLGEFPGRIDSERVTRDLLARNHPHSWTLAEASLPVLESVEAILAGPSWSDARVEARRKAEQDEAESFAGWLEEWPEPRSSKNTWVSEFAKGNLALARSTTWRVAGDRVYWRNERGVQEADISRFSKFEAFLPLVVMPIAFLDLTTETTATSEPRTLSLFIEEGISEGWLRLVPR